MHSDSAVNAGNQNSQNLIFL